MSNKLTQKYGLRFRKGERLKVLFQLLWNAVLYTKWRIYKCLHGIHHPVVHYYAVCWNEEKMLPFMFQHYDTFVDKFFIYDNESTDKSADIIAVNPKAKKISFQTEGFEDEIQNTIKNECWKASRGKADYVIVCDIDEFLYTPNTKAFLSHLQASGISMPLSQGFDMCNPQFPDYGTTPSLVETVKTGVPNRDYSKCILFSPYKIVDVNYEPGAHFCHPYGLINSDETPYYVLHYKYLGVEYVLERTRQYRMRMSKDNIAKGYALQYLEEETAIKDNIEKKLLQAKVVIE